VRSSGTALAQANAKPVFFLPHEQVIGVHSMFGGFFLGVITPRGNGFAMRMTERIEVRAPMPQSSGTSSVASLYQALILTTIFRT